MSMEEAIGLARHMQPGMVLSAEWRCNVAKACAYFVRIRDASNRVSEHQVEDAKPADEVNLAGAMTLSLTTPQPGTSQDAGQTGSDWRLASSLYWVQGSGQAAGLGNVILNPLAQMGGRLIFQHSAWPDWTADGQLGLIYGRTESSDPITLQKTRSTPGWQEVHGRAHLIYDFHKDGEAARAGVGLYADFARALHSLPRYLPPEANDAYAAEEGEITRSMFNSGLDLRLAMRQQRVRAELHNVLFVNGTRIAPNLLTYKPMLGFMWRNEFAINGTIDHPGWSLLTNVDFYFARKAGVAYFNTHDGLAGTKRELDLSYGFGYTYSPKLSLSVLSYGNNNLNRGTSAMVPVGFKDGLRVGLDWQVD